MEKDKKVVEKEKQNDNNTTQKIECEKEKKAEKFKVFTIPSIISIVWGGYITLVVSLNNLFTSTVIGKYNSEVLEVIQKSDPNMRIENLTGEVKAVYITYLNELNSYRIMLVAILLVFSFVLYLLLSNYYDKKIEKISKG